MSTPLIVLASILAFLALVVIPFVMIKSDQQQNRQQQQSQVNPREKPQRKKKKR